MLYGFITEPAALGDEPFVCDSASTPVEVALPPGMIKLLGAAGQGTEDEPVGVVFTVPIFTGSNSEPNPVALTPTLALVVDPLLRP